jgi:hypothetical protein
MNIRSILAVIAVCLGFAAAPAHAKAGFISYGDELFTVADFPESIQAAEPQIKQMNMKLGYKCSHIAVLWADVWTWDCTLVGLSGEKTYHPMPDEARPLETAHADTVPVK